MMQDGLHIGLAAWINRQRGADSFVVYPAMPIVTELANLEAIQSAKDLARAAEFSRLVNFVPRQGQVADAFGAAAVLWEIHRNILANMDFASEPWTNEERRQYQSARDVLYTTDAAGHLAPSVMHLLYEEMKNAWEDLSETNASATELAEAMANWTVLGYKQQVENAQATISRLASRSTRYQAEEERLSLVDVRLPRQGELSFAPTYFAPISALARESWMEAKVSFDDLDRAVDNGPESGKWKAYLGNRSGEVLFDYVVLRCLRSWYTPALYQADDWRLTSGDAMVSRGNGNEGMLPAYVDEVYLVSVKNVTSHLRPPPQLQPVRSRVFAGLQLEHLPAGMPAKPLGVGEPLPGVSRKAIKADVVREARPVDADTVVAVGRNAGVLSTGEPASPERLLATGIVTKIDAIDVNHRVMLAHAYLAEWGRPVATPAGIFKPPAQLNEPSSSLIYVAGFGCVKTPFAPNPNVNYQW